MSIIIDRRGTPANNVNDSRRKFLARHKEAIKRAVDAAINKTSIKDIKKTGTKVGINQNDIKEHPFEVDKLIGRTVVAGNPKHVKGDLIPIPKDSQSKGGSSESGDGEDYFFDITRQEFLEILLEDLALPNLIKTALLDSTHVKYTRAGYVSSGMPTNLNLLQSYKNALARRISTNAAIDREIEKNKDNKEEIERLEEQRKTIPFFADIDLKYNLFLPEIVPITAAVMFCIMDVSGSMDTDKKELAKRFYILLYLFLTKNYEKVDVVFIKHGTDATECTEEEFFSPKSEGGGTIISTGLELGYKIQQERYPTSQYNIYLAQAGDGENWPVDDDKSLALLQKWLNISQYVFVVACSSYFMFMSRATAYAQQVARAKVKNLSFGLLERLSDIYPVFRAFFRRGKDES